MTMFAVGMTARHGVIPTAEPGSRRRRFNGAHFVFTLYCVSIVAASTAISDAATITSAM